MPLIDVYADIWCPFTHVGLERLVAKRAELGLAAPLRVHAWPLELVNGAPLDAAFIAEEIDDLQAQVAADLFGGFRIDTFPTSTLPALALVESAYDIDLATGEALSLAVRRALFEQGLDIGDAAILADLCEFHGVPPAQERHVGAVQTSLDEGRNRGVVGSPHFFTASGGFFCPALDIERVNGHLRIKPDLPAFEMFVESCFR